MLTIELKFLTGKWHATPWGRQVNEGAVEWPPAPWRILRTLLAVWHHKHPDVSESEIRELIKTLATEPPVYQLPPHFEGHTRHYMKGHPKIDKKKPENNYPGGKPDKVFDTFLTLPANAPLRIHWPSIKLTESQSQLLEKLLHTLSYFGRAESWVEARITQWEGSANAFPLNGSAVEEHQELIRLLAPGKIDQYADWRKETVTAACERKLAEKKSNAVAKRKPVDKIKLSAKDVEKIEAAVPEDFFAALHMETSDLRQAGWNQPPASQWVNYVREKQIPVVSKSRRPSGSDLPTIARFAIAGAVLPKLTDTISISERVRSSLIKISDGNPVFIGRNKEENGSQLARGHLHAHIFCESNNNAQGRITHVTIFAPGGFDCDSEATLMKFMKTWGSGGHDLQFVLLGMGHPADFGGLNEKKGEAPLCAKSSVWMSRTPFVPADRLRRQYQTNDPQDKIRFEKDISRIIRKELERRDWLRQHHETLESVTLMDNKSKLGGHETSWHKFNRERYQGGGTRGSSSGYGLRLNYAVPVEGPIALGYASHFGLGLFVPEIAS